MRLIRLILCWSQQILYQHFCHSADVASLLRLCLSSVGPNPFHIQFQQGAYKMCIKAVLTCTTIKSTIRLPTQRLSNLHKNLSNLFLLLQSITKRLYSVPCTSNYSKITRQMYLCNIVPFFMQIIKMKFMCKVYQQKNTIKIIRKNDQNTMDAFLHNIT